MHFRTLSIGVVILAMTTASASALCTGTPLFEDSFDDNLTGWVEDDKKAIRDGTYVFKAGGSGSVDNFIPNFVFEAESLPICAEYDVQLKQEGYTGLIFWHTDWSNYYLAWYDDEDKEFVTSRYLDREWSTIARTPHDLGDTEIIDLKIAVQISGNVVATFLNGTEIHKFRGQAPRGKFRFGLTGGNSEEVVFRDIRVTEMTE